MPEYKDNKKRGFFAWCRMAVVPALMLMPVLLAGCMQYMTVQPSEYPVIDLLVVPSVSASYEEDRIAPRLMGVRDLTVYAGDSLSYLKNVTASDDRDPNPVITVDSSNVDLSRTGSYEAVYTATDSSGNSSRAAIMVTVLEKENDFVDMDTINAAADAVLEELLWDGATTEEQVYAIYRWARTDLRYAGHSERDDYHQAAYRMLTGGSGDCYGYFAVTKLLFERLGIPSIDVVKVRNFDNDSDHFWSLVSVDGGESWYHFDSTPRYGEGDDFCLVTDAYLDAYSENNKNSHNRDKSLYPATPE